MKSELDALETYSDAWYAYVADWAYKTHTDIYDELREHSRDKINRWARKGKSKLRTFNDAKLTLGQETASQKLYRESTARQYEEIRKEESTKASDNPSAQIRKAFADLNLSEEEYEAKVKSYSTWDVMSKDELGEPKKTQMSSIKLDFVPKGPNVNLLLPAERTPEDPNLNHSIARRKADLLTEQLWVVQGDEQLPFSDSGMEQAFLRFLRAVQPTHAINLGDLLDFATISKYADNPEWDDIATPQACIDAGYLTFRDRLLVSPDTLWTYLEGNHDARLRLELLRRAERLYGLRPGTGVDEPALEPLLTLRNLLRLDELGIEYIAPRGNYTHAEKFITPELAVIHGDKTGKTAIENMLSEIDYSIIQGHNHKAIHIAKTIKTKGGQRVVHGVNIGTFAEIEGGTGYTARPNWQNHFVTVAVDSEGSFHIEDAWYDGEAITWRGKRY